jgi:hypothetical protein
MKLSPQLKIRRSIVLALLSVTVAVISGVALYQKNTDAAMQSPAGKQNKAHMSYIESRAARAWDLPVMVQKTTDGRLIVKNQSDDALPVTFQVIGGKQVSIVIPKKSARLFQATPGDIVEISCSGFESVLVRAGKWQPNQQPEPTRFARGSS